MVWSDGGSRRPVLGKETGILFATFFLVLTLFFSTNPLLAEATTSNQIWIPSPDVQPFGTIHVGVDTRSTLFATIEEGGYDAPTSYGLTVGAVQTPFISIEVGVDLKEQSNDPWYFNTKVSVLEESLFEHSPSLTIGIYDIGMEQDLVGYNISYALLGKTIPVAGRVAFGYYYGNEDFLKNADGQSDYNGFLFSWDRTLAEVDDRLWVAVDYMGSENKYGAISLGAAWRFSPNIGALIGYQIYNDPEVAGENTFTVQFDIDL